MATITANTGSNNYNTNGAWVGGVQPSAADDVVIPASAVVTIPTGTTVLGRSITVQASGTLAFAATSSILALGDGTAGAGNVAINISSSATITLTGVGVIQLVSTSATQQTIATGGKTMPSLTVNGVGSSYLLSSTFVQNSNATMIFQNGTFNTGNFNCSWGTTTLSSGTKTVTLGSSTITIIGGGLNFSTNSTNFTLNTGTSLITFNPTAAVVPTISLAGGQTYYDISVVKSSGGFSPTLGTGTSVTIHNLTVDNSVLGTGNRPLQFTSNVTFNITGTFTHNGTNAAGSRAFMTSATNGQTTTIALGASGTASMTDVDFRDIAFTGTNTPVTAAAGRLADGGGNSGITFASPVTYYWIGNGGSMTSPAKYSTSSGGSAGSVVPLVHDILVFDANSITSASQTITNDMMRMPGLDFTNVLNSPTYNPRNPNGAGNGIFGSFILKSGMTFSSTSASGSSTIHGFNGRGLHTITQAGVAFDSTFSSNISAISGTYSLGSDLTIDPSKTLTHNNGTFNANNYNWSVGVFNSSNGATRTINMGSGTLTLTGTGTVLQLSTMTGLTFNANTSTIAITDTSASSKTLAHGSALVLNNVSITGGGTGAVIFGANSLTINNLTVTGGPKTLTFTAGGGSATTFLGTIGAIGSLGNLITLNSATPGSPFIFNKSFGVVSADYLSLQDSTVQGGATWFAGFNSTNVSGNTGWIFREPDTKFLEMF